MTDQLTQQEVNATAWAACDTFRGAVDPAQYKDYILVMLFLKYISDQWADHYAEYKKEYGDNEERIRRKLERERFILLTRYVTAESRREIDHATTDRRTELVGQHELPRVGDSDHCNRPARVASLDKLPTSHTNQPQKLPFAQHLAILLLGQDDFLPRDSSNETPPMNRHPTGSARDGKQHLSW